MLNIIKTRGLFTKSVKGTKMGVVILRKDTLKAFHDFLKKATKVYEVMFFDT